MIQDRLDIIPEIEEDDIRLLKTIEYQMSNHEWIPVPSISKNSDLDPQDAEYRINRVGELDLLDGKQLAEKSYRLNRKGYDVLAIKELARNKVLDSLSNSQIGVGKEADVYSGIREGDHLAVKIFRIGRTSFTSVKLSRRGFSPEKENWLYLSKLTAKREMEALEKLYPEIDVPRPIGQNRHILVTEVIDGVPMNDLVEIGEEIAKKALDNVIQNIRKALEIGVIHSDLSRFNIFIQESGEITLFDWPQYVTLEHPDAFHYLKRDIENVAKDFGRFDVNIDPEETLSELKSDFDVE